MGVGDWLTLIAILVALFGQRIWRYFDTERKKTEARLIIKQNLEQLKSDLLRIRDERNADWGRDSIIFNSTSFSEVNGYYFLFSDLLLPNIDQLELSKYPATIEFFNHYKINIETIRKREEDRAGTGALTRGTVNNLIARLEKAISEFDRTEVRMCAKKIKKIIAREGLIILGIILTGLILRFVGEQLWNFSCPTDATKTGISSFVPCKYQLLSNISIYISKSGRFILFFVYPLYLLIRFILWAIKTLKEGK